MPDKTEEKQAKEYAKYGMSLLKGLTWYFQEAELEAKRKLLVRYSRQN